MDLLAVQGTLKSLLKNHSSKASILQYSAFFMVHLLHPLMISGKTIVLTIQTFAGKAMSPLFSMLLGFSWLFFQGASIFFFFSTTVVTIYSDFEAQENKACHCFHCFSRYCHEVMELDAMTIPKENKCKKAKWLPEEALQIT